MENKNRDEILLRFLRFGGEERGTPNVEPLFEDDWEEVIELSSRHGMTPLLYHRLQKIPNIPVPANVLQRLREVYLKSAARNVRLYHELGRLLKILRRHDIPVVLLKGVHLAQLVYQNIALRPMGDVDLLVRRDDLGRVDATMLELGYIPTERNRIATEHYFHFAYRQPDSGFSVEIHWNIFDSVHSFDIDINGLCERSLAASVAGVEAWVLCPEDLLLHLCLHSAKHVFEMGVRSVYDVSEVVRQHDKEMDWEQVKLRARQWGIEKSVFLTLRLTRELLGTAIPIGLLESLEISDFDERFLTLAKEQIFICRHQTSDGLGLTCNITQSLAAGRLLDKMSLLLKRLFPSRKEMTLWYPPPSDSVRIYLYYPVRVKDLLQRYSRQVWRLWRGDREMRALFEQENRVNSLRQWLMSP